MYSHNILAGITYVFQYLLQMFLLAWLAVNFDEQNHLHKGTCNDSILKCSHRNYIYLTKYLPALETHSLSVVVVVDADVCVDLFLSVLVIFLGLINHDER